MAKGVQRAMLVYQCGIANVFRVHAFNLADYGRAARRLYQGDFHGARMMAMGLGVAGATVRTAACNMAGDIAKATWSEDLAAQPFADQLAMVAYEGGLDLAEVEGSAYAAE